MPLLRLSLAEASSKTARIVLATAEGVLIQAWVHGDAEAGSQGEVPEVAAEAVRKIQAGMDLGQVGQFRPQAQIWPGGQVGLQVRVGMGRIPALPRLQLAQTPQACPEALVCEKAVPNSEAISSQPASGESEGREAQAQARGTAHGVAPDHSDSAYAAGLGPPQETCFQPGTGDLGAQGQGEGIAIGVSPRGIQVREVHGQELSGQQVRWMPVQAEVLAGFHEVRGDQQGLPRRSRGQGAAIIQEIPTPREQIPDPG